MRPRTSVRVTSAYAKLREETSGFEHEAKAQQAVLSSSLKTADDAYGSKEDTPRRRMMHEAQAEARGEARSGKPRQAMLRPLINAAQAAEDVRKQRRASRGAQAAEEAPRTTGWELPRGFLHGSLAWWRLTEKGWSPWRVWR